MGWYEALKDAIAVADNFKDIELKQKLVDLQMECVKLAEENVKLRQELLGANEQLKLKISMNFKNNVYWRKNDAGKEEGPFCPKCLDGSDKPSRMSERPDDYYWRCQVCGCCIEKPGSHYRQTQAETEFDPFK